MSSTLEKIQRQIAENPILLYMKGSPKLPSCGFSAQAVQALSACGERFAYVDILQNPDIRAELPKYANWPTFPQLWVDGELVGGCDIVIEMYQRGELQQLQRDGGKVPYRRAKSGVIPAISKKATSWKSLFLSLRGGYGQRPAAQTLPAVHDLAKQLRRLLGIIQGGVSLRAVERHTRGNTGFRQHRLAQRQPA